MRKPRQSGPIYFACLLILNLIAGGAIAVAKNVDATDPYSILSVQEILNKINKGEKLSAVTKPGECLPGEGAICEHDTPKKIETARVEDEQAEQEVQKLRSIR